MVRTGLEFSIQFWSLRPRMDIIKLEKIQKRYTSMSLRQEGLSNMEGLNKIGFTLGCRSLRGVHLQNK